MTRQDRINLIKKIEVATDSKVLVFITGDRQGLETRISHDVIPFIYKHLEKIGETQKINLFLYTAGGVTISGYSIANMIREYCKEYGVIVPFKCLSTGTLMVLGANTIIMSKMGQLGPVDPSLQHPLGPEAQHPQNPAIRGKVSVNVEDVVSFFDLAKKEAKTTSEGEFTKVMSMLADNIHPLILGAVNRSRNEIRFLAKTLLKQHLNDAQRIESIVNTLVEERFSHSYLMGRKEAKDIQLNIIDVPASLTASIMSLYHEYAQALQLDVPYNAETALGTDTEKTITLNRSLIESEHMTHTYSTTIRLSRVQIDDSQTGIPMRSIKSESIKEEWLQNNNV